MLSEGVDVMNMMEGSFDFKQFQVDITSLPLPPSLPIPFPIHTQKHCYLQQIPMTLYEVYSNCCIVWLLCHGCECSVGLFQGKLDTGKAAVIGHSFGGATTIQALSEDQRFL